MGDQNTQDSTLDGHFPQDFEEAGGGGGGGTSTDTRVNVSDDGAEVQEDAEDINFGTDLDVTDDGDGSVTVDSTGGGGGTTSVAPASIDGNPYVATGRFDTLEGTYDIMADLRNYDGGVYKVNFTSTPGMSATNQTISTFGTPENTTLTGSVYGTTFTDSFPGIFRDANASIYTLANPNTTTTLDLSVYAGDFPSTVYYQDMKFYKQYNLPGTSGSVYETGPTLSFTGVEFTTNASATLKIEKEDPVGEEGAISSLLVQYYDGTSLGYTVLNAGLNKIKAGRTLSPSFKVAAAGGGTPAATFSTFQYILGLSFYGMPDVTSVDTFYTPS